jgi:glucose-fructose oxidoreductase
LVTALVSSDPAKRAALGKRYGIERVFDYDTYDQCLRDVDAVYIALPNFMHADFAIRAAKAGVHVLCEKPMAVTAAECEQMIGACDQADVRLMVAYRLHFEPLTLEVLDLVRQGRIGEPKYFNSSFSMKVRPDNIRVDPIDRGGGTLYDIGVYCINAARTLFGADPREVVAASVNSGAAHLADVDESTAGILRFEGGRLASFVTSFNAAGYGSYDIVGTRGTIHVEPGYSYASGLSYTMVAGQKTTKKKIAPRDQFAAELLYFSTCVQEGRDPEPSGFDGWQDVRIIQALYESANAGKAIELPFVGGADRAPSAAQAISKPGIDEPRLVHVTGPTANDR